jgi:hypothetical protein
LAVLDYVSKDGKGSKVSAGSKAAGGASLEQAQLTLLGYCFKALSLRALSRGVRHAVRDVWVAAGKALGVGAPLVREVMDVVTGVEMEEDEDDDDDDEEEEDDDDDEDDDDSGSDQNEEGEGTKSQSGQGSGFARLPVDADGPEASSDSDSDAAAHCTSIANTPRIRGRPPTSDKPRNMRRRKGWRWDTGGANGPAPKDCG